jgi:glutamine synthetase
MKGEQHFAASIMNKKDLLYYIKPEQQNEKDLHTILAMHPEIQFVSLMGVDFAGNDTDEKIPMKIFLEDTADFLEGSAAQTDGSSVVLPGIATLNNARVDLTVDKSVNWYVDYTTSILTQKAAKWLVLCVFLASLFITIIMFALVLF